MADGQVVVEGAAVAGVHEMVLAKVSMGDAGARYSVTHRGEVIVASSRDPEHDACRVLLARGIIDRLVTRWNGSPHTAMSMDIEWGAARRTAEGSGSGPRTSAWAPFAGVPHDEE